LRHVLFRLTFSVLPPLLPSFPTRRSSDLFLGALTAKLDLAAVHHLLRRFASGSSGRVYLITAGGQPLAGSETEREDLMQRRLDSAVTRRLLDHEGLTIEFTGLQGERSEEHTSELQSLAYLVCRLL